MATYHSKETEKLYEAVISLENTKECRKFFEDICTVKELLDLAQRLQIALMLKEGKNYQEISAETGASTATISRVNKCLLYGTGGSENNIVGEFSSNGYDNDLSHERGVISMARSSDPNSASSQFFICHEDAPHLDGDYAAFGVVTGGLDVVDAVCEKAEPSDGNGTIPTEAQPVIKSVIIRVE